MVIVTPKRHICRSFRVFREFMRQNRSMGLAWPRSREKKKKKKKQEKNKKIKKVTQGAYFAKIQQAVGAPPVIRSGPNLAGWLGPLTLSRTPILGSID